MLPCVCCSGTEPSGTFTGNRRPRGPGPTKPLEGPGGGPGFQEHAQNNPEHPAKEPVPLCGWGRVRSIAGTLASTPRAAGQGREPAPLSSCRTLGQATALLRRQRVTARHTPRPRLPGAPSVSWEHREDSCHHTLRTHTGEAGARQRAPQPARAGAEAAGHPGQVAERPAPSPPAPGCSQGRTLTRLVCSRTGHGTRDTGHGASPHPPSTLPLRERPRVDAGLDSVCM